MWALHLRCRLVLWVFGLRHVAVGDEIVDVFPVADLEQVLLSDLAAVEDIDPTFGMLQHFLPQAGLGLGKVGDHPIPGDALGGEKADVHIKLRNRPFCNIADEGIGILQKHSPGEVTADMLFPKLFQGLDAVGDDREILLRCKVVDDVPHRCGGVHKHGVPVLKQSGGPLAQGGLDRGVGLLPQFIGDDLVREIGNGGPAVASEQKPGLLQLGQIPADGNGSHIQPLGQEIDRTELLLLQEIHDLILTFTFQHA